MSEYKEMLAHQSDDTSEYILTDGNILKNDSVNFYLFHGDNYIIHGNTNDINIEYITISKLLYVSHIINIFGGNDTDIKEDAYITFNDGKTLVIKDLYDYEYNDNIFTIRTYDGKKYMLPTINHKSITIKKTNKLIGG